MFTSYMTYSNVYLSYYDYQTDSVLASQTHIYSFNNSLYNDTILETHLRKTFHILKSIKIVMQEINSSRKCLKNFYC